MYIGIDACCRDGPVHETICAQGSVSFAIEHMLSSKNANPAGPALRSPRLWGGVWVYGACLQSPWFTRWITQGVEDFGDIEQGMEGTEAIDEFHDVRRGVPARPKPQKLTDGKERPRRLFSQIHHFYGLQGNFIDLHPEDRVIMGLWSFLCLCDLVQLDLHWDWSSLCSAQPRQTNAGCFLCDWPKLCISILPRTCAPNASWGEAVLLVFTKRGMELLGHTD